MQALLRQGIKVLVLCPQDSAAAAESADEARAAGVRVIGSGRPILGTASVDDYVDFDNGKVGAAMGQYLVDRAGATTGNSLYLYAGNAVDNNSFKILAGAWRRLQPKIADGTFVIRNSSAATELAAKPTLGRAELARIIAQVTTRWDFGTARTLAAGNLASTRTADRRTIFVLAPNDTTARAIAEAIAADGAVTKAYVTGQDADQASVQAIIDGSQGMTVFKDHRTRVEAVVAAAAAFLEGGAPAVNSHARQRRHRHPVAAPGARRGHPGQRPGGPDRHRLLQGQRLHRLLAGQAVAATDTGGLPTQRCTSRPGPGAR